MPSAGSLGVADLQDVIQAAADELVASGAETGLQVAVRHQGRVAAEVASGVADPRTGAAVRPGTLFYAASAAKGVAASLAHVLAEHGDLGYDLQRGPGYKAGPFVGYNYFKETANAFNCQQMANAVSGICAPAVAPGTLTITETARWQSLRVGYAAETMLVDRVKISGDIAYLPYVAFEGRDDHWLRAIPTNFLQRSQAGQGVQTEVILSYLVTPNFSLGVGGRYWAMWTAGGSFVCNGCSGISVTLPPVPSKNNTERFGMFFQGSYLFDTSGVAAAGK